MTDISKLLEAEASQEFECIYLVSFEVLARVDENHDDWVSDELQVKSTVDGLDAVNRLKAHLSDPDEYGMPIKGFRLRALKPLAEADI